nr:LpqB family beta-propeller domain-containing protein [Streptomyces coryli]
MANEKDFRTAKEYLTKRERGSWRPEKTTVLAEEPSPRELSPGGKGDLTAQGEGNTVRVRLTGTQLAVVDDRNAYVSSEQKYRKDIELRKNSKGEWRISQPPPGLVLGEANFHRTYLQAEKYYYGAVHKQSLVPEPVYVRRGLDLTDAVQSLLAGPGAQLLPGVTNPIPPGTELAGKSLAPDGDMLRVRLKLPKNKRLSADACQAAARQVFYTAKSQLPSGLARVELERDGGGSLCGVTSAQARDVRPEGLFGSLDNQYFIDTEHRLVQLPASPDSDVKPDRVPGVLGADGADGVKLRSAGVARDERHAAAVSEDGSKMYVAGLDSGAKLKDPALTSKSKRTGDDRGLTAPSWDGAGDVWVADRTADGSTLYRLRDQGRAKAEEVLVPDLGDGRIESLRVSAEGARIALLVERDDRTTLQLGSIMPGDDGKLMVARLENAAPQMQDVRGFSWAGESQLIVVGTTSKGVQQLKYVDTDGSVPLEPPRGLNGVTAIAAGERSDRPLIADSEDGIVRLPPDADWRRVAKKGSAPVYPG